MITADQLIQFAGITKAMGYRIRHSLPTRANPIMEVRLYLKGSDIPTGDVAHVEGYAGLMDTYERWVAKYSEGAKTPVEVERIKSEWLIDPCWEIEDTPGFEFHYDELLAYRREKDAQHEAAWERAMLKKAEEMGVPGNLQLAIYVNRLENRIVTLYAKLRVLEMG